jgi:hypothetical protein
MKLKYILIILFIGVSFQLLAQKAIKDTIFILKDTVEGHVQTIFIDDNRESLLYEEISHFEFQHFDKISYNNSIDYFKEHNITLTKAKPVIPLTNWVTLKQYKGQYYVYHPCDFLFHFQQSINDTTFIYWTGEGPVANKIIEQKKINSGTYKFLLTGINDHNRSLIIHILNKKKGIAIFEEKVGERRTVYFMIAANKIRRVPIIVNHCPKQKQLELEFDAIDLTTNKMKDHIK